VGRGRPDLLGGGGEARRLRAGGMKRQGPLPRRQLRMRFAGLTPIGLVELFRTAPGDRQRSPLLPGVEAGDLDDLADVAGATRAYANALAAYAKVPANCAKPPAARPGFHRYESGARPRGALTLLSRLSRETESPEVILGSKATPTTSTASRRCNTSR
jgi:hypothetical protein